MSDDRHNHVPLPNHTSWSALKARRTLDLKSARSQNRRVRNVLLALGGIGLALLAATQVLRASDAGETDDAWRFLGARADQNPAAFVFEMVQGLPEPTQRYFRFAIAPGTPLKTVATVEMGGRFGLGERLEHRFYPMRARQILAPPHGFVWVPEIGSGAMRMSGSDALLDQQAWTRFWLLGVVPLARVQGAGDIARSAVGRLIGESLWVPASLLPSRGVRWEAVDADTARAHVLRNGEHHAFDLTVGADGRPLRIELLRWSNVNREKTFRWQPFGATFDDWATFEGFTVPTGIKGGNHFGTDDYFPFFQARVSSIAYR